jgi:hypothetical protein
MYRAKSGEGKVLHPFFNSLWEDLGAPKSILSRLSQVRDAGGRVCAEMMDFVRAIGVLWFGLLAFHGAPILAFAVAWCSFEGKGTGGMKIRRTHYPL